jgi:hypothetical protein
MSVVAGKNAYRLTEDLTQTKIAVLEKKQQRGRIEDQRGKGAHVSPLGEVSLSEKKEPDGWQADVKPSPNRARLQSLLGCQRV